MTAIFIPLAKGGASLAFLNATRVPSYDQLDRASRKAAGSDATIIPFQQGKQMRDQRHDCLNKMLRCCISWAKANSQQASIAPFYLSRSTQRDYVAPTNIAAVRAGQLRGRLI